MKHDEAVRRIHMLLCFMASSARGLFGEPRVYGPFRLLDAMTRLIDALEELDLDDPYFHEVRDQIDRFKFKVMEDEAAFIEGIDALVKGLASRLRENREARE
ncbi:MAG: DUF6092 family protein [Bacillota bacterium]